MAPRVPSQSYSALCTEKQKTAEIVLNNLFGAHVHVLSQNPVSPLHHPLPSLPNHTPFTTIAFSAMAVARAIFRFILKNVAICLEIVSDHHDELFYICLLFGIVVLILLSSILVVIGRIVLNKRRITNAAKLQTSETGTTALPTECTETISNEMDIDLTAPATIPSISRNNVSGRVFAGD